jgi:hypothetical protein
LVGVLVLILGLGVTTWALRDRNSADLQLGDQTFQAGSAEDKAELIADSGPILYGDVSGRRDRDMILQHLGDDPDTGWYAFLAAPLDKARDCTWIWQPDDELFRARCDESLTAPADGKGLPQFEVTVRDGEIEVDLNADTRTDTDPDSDSDTDPDPDESAPASEPAGG